MSFKILMTDKVSLIKKNGRRFEDIKASVQQDKIFLFDIKIPVEEGDIFERVLPNGILEKYVIHDAGYYEGVAGINSHYQCHVMKEKKDKMLQEKHSPKAIYNLNGPGCRVNINSTDQSENTFNKIESDRLFQNLHSVIKHSISDEDIALRLAKVIDKMQCAQDQTTFLAKYKEFMSLAANHMSVFAPFIPALSQMLGN